MAKNWKNYINKDMMVALQWRGRKVVCKLKDRVDIQELFFFNCAAHKLNLVANDLNTVPEIRNSVSTVKLSLFFFQLEFKEILCETRLDCKI